MEENNRVPNVDRSIYNNESDTYTNKTDTYTEETAAEISAPIDFERSTNTQTNEQTGAGRGFGYAGLILAILSLFTAPILFGAAGIILGFVARNRGARTLGNWAIGLGVLSVVVSMFLAPFF